MDHREVLGLDPLEVEREEVGAEAVGHAVLEARRGAVLVGAEDPAAALLAHVPARVGVAQHRVLGVGAAELDQRRVGLGDDVLVLDRDRRELQPEQPRGALGVVAGGGDDVLGADLEALLGGHQVAALLGHHAAARRSTREPVQAKPSTCALRTISTPQLARALGHRLGHVGGVDVAVGRVEERADEVLGAHQRPAVLISAGRQPLEGDADGLGGGGVELEFVHARPGLRHAQVADDREAGVQPGLGLQRLVELHRAVVDVAGGVAHVEERQEARGVPGGAGGQLVALEQHRVGPAGLRQVVGDRRADRAAADHHRPRMAPHRSPPLLPAAHCLAERGRAQGRRARRSVAGLRPAAPRRWNPRRPLRVDIRRRCVSKRARTSREGDRHENRRIACGRRAGARRLRNRAAEPLTISEITVQADLPSIGSRAGGRLLAGPERRPGDGAGGGVRRAASTRSASASSSTWTS